jgi:hypothetical protein
VHLVPCESGGQVSRQRQRLWGWDARDRLRRRGHPAAAGGRAACRCDCACSEVAQGMGMCSSTDWLCFLVRCTVWQPVMVSFLSGLPTPRDDALAIGPYGENVCSAPSCL